MAKTVKYAKLHQGIFVAGIGTIGDTLPPTSKNFPDWKMTKVADGVDCQAKKDHASPLVQFWIPSANIAILTYGPEEVDAEADKAVTVAPKLPTTAVIKPKGAGGPPKNAAADNAAFDATVKAEKSQA